jgi:hypothetical protein
MSGGVLVLRVQESAYFEAKSAFTTLSNNVVFNGPRAGYNINDLAGGGLLVQRNLMFNLVRETSDHGPINSWNRQVYVTNFAGSPSTFPAAPVRVDTNFILANYHSGWAVDNDDGSAYWITTNLVQVYGNSEMKSDFAGHSNTHENNLAIYLNIAMDTTNVVASNYTDVFRNNTLVFAGASFAGFPCTAPSIPVTSLNTYYYYNTSSFNACGYNFTTWQHQGNEVGTVLRTIPANDTIFLAAIAAKLNLQL